MDYSNYEEYSRFQNLDGIEAKIIAHLIESDSHYADRLWKLLKYATPDALAKPNLTKEEKKALVFTGDNGKPDATSQGRIFLAPFIDDAWQEQCSSLYIYVDHIKPTDRMVSVVDVNIETVVHSQTSVIYGDGDSFQNEFANPNDSDSKGNVVVAVKNRATVLLKCILAVLNGMYIDGIGYLQFNRKVSDNCKVQQVLWNTRSFYGHRITLATLLSGTSDGNYLNNGF